MRPSEREPHQTRPARAKTEKAAPKCPSKGSAWPRRPGRCQAPQMNPCLLFEALHCGHGYSSTPLTFAVRPGHEQKKASRAEHIRRYSSVRIQRLPLHRHQTTFRLRLRMPQLPHQQTEAAQVAFAVQFASLAMPPAQPPITVLPARCNTPVPQIFPPRLPPSTSPEIARQVGVKESTKVTNPSGSVRTISSAN